MSGPPRAATAPDVAPGPRAPTASPRPQVALRLERDASGRTFLARKFATYPFFCAAPFHLDRSPPGMLTVFVQSCSGGLYEGDRLAWTIDVRAGAQAHVAPQGATVAHAMPHGGEARHAVRIDAAAGSLVEYLPDPLILLPSARVRSHLEVVAAPGATVIVGDAFLTHDPAGRGGPFDRFAAETLLRRPGAAPFALDRVDVTGAFVEQAWRLLVPHPCEAQGSLWVCAPGSSEALAATLHHALGQVSGLHAGASTLPDGSGAVARLLARDALSLAEGFRTAWRAVRGALVGAPPASRRQSGWL
jgi:urease accessory protein